MIALFPPEDITQPVDGSTVQLANLQPIVSEVSGHNELPEAAAEPVVINAPTIGSTDTLEEVVSNANNCTTNDKTINGIIKYRCKIMLRCHDSKSCYQFSLNDFCEC